MSHMSPSTLFPAEYWLTTKEVYRNSVVRLNDHPNMTIAVYHGGKGTAHTQNTCLKPE